MSQRLDRIKVAGAYEAEIKDWIKVRITHMRVQKARSRTL